MNFDNLNKIRNATYEGVENATNNVTWHETRDVVDDVVWIEMNIPLRDATTEFLNEL